MKPAAILRGLAGVCLWLAAALPVAAQELPSSDRPSSRPLEIPDLEQPAEPPVLVVPRSEAPDPDAPPVDLSSLSFDVQRVEFVGNTVFDADELRAVARPWLGRRLTGAQLRQLRDAITRHYFEAGYLTSGAVLPDQSLAGGELMIQIVEGHLARIEIEGNRWFRNSALRARIEGDRDAILNVRDLEQRLQLLQRDDRITRLRAHLKPDAERGESLLRLQVEEAFPVRVSAGVDDYISPSAGDVRGTATAELTNVTGYGDRLWLGYAGAEGLQDVEGRYEVPLGYWGTFLRLRGRYSSGVVVEPPFNVLDLEAETISASVQLSQRLNRGLNLMFEYGVIAEWRQRTTRSLGGLLTNLTPGAERGRTRVAALRFFGQLSYRDRKQVVALRSTVSAGFDWLGATSHDGPLEDGQFVSWLAQAQWYRRLGPLGMSFVWRGVMQLSNSPLLPMERFSLGGYSTVRGYRENLFVRDNGFASSSELRIPLWRRGDETSMLDFVPFLDFGGAWRDRGPNPGPRVIAAVGAGLRFQPWRRVHTELFWGWQLNPVEPRANFGLEGQAIYFRVALSSF